MVECWICGILNLEMMIEDIHQLLKRRMKIEFYPFDCCLYIFSSAKNILWRIFRSPSCMEILLYMKNGCSYHILMLIQPQHPPPTEGASHTPHNIGFPGKLHTKPR